MSHETVSVLLPQAERFERPDPGPLAPRLADIRGARIGFIDNGFAATALIDDELRVALAEYDITAFVLRKQYWLHLDDAGLTELAGHADAVVGGLCNSPPSTAWGARDSIELEKRGIPTVTLATKFYADLLGETVVWDGMADLRRITFPYPLEGQSEENVRVITREALDGIVSALTDPGGPTVFDYSDRKWAE
jgi:hypothetical protein